MLDASYNNNFSYLLQPTEKIISSSINLITKLENLELLRGSAPATMGVNNEFRNEPTPAYEIFGNLENLILSETEEDEEFFMPALEGMYNTLHATIKLIKCIDF